MEKIPNDQETFDSFSVETLSPQSKMRYLLEVFDLGKDKNKNEERKKDFISLMEKYHQSYLRSKIDLSHSRKDGENYTKGRAELHNRIMEIITNISLSIGISPKHRKVAEYLSQNRDEVTKIINSYFSTIVSNTADSPSNYLRLKEQLHLLSKDDGPEEE